MIVLQIAQFSQCLAKSWGFFLSHLQIQLRHLFVVFLCIHPLVRFTRTNFLVENFVIMILRKIQHHTRIYILPVNCSYVHIRCVWDCTFLVTSRYGFFTSKHGALQWSWCHIINVVWSLDWNNIGDWNVQIQPVRAMQPSNCKNCQENWHLHHSWITLHNKTKQ